MREMHSESMLMRRNKLKKNKYNKCLTDGNLKGAYKINIHPHKHHRLMYYRVMTQSGFCFDFIKIEMSQFFKVIQLKRIHCFCFNFHFDVTARFQGCELLYQHLFNAVMFSGGASERERRGVVRSCGQLWFLILQR